MLWTRCVTNLNKHAILVSSSPLPACMLPSAPACTSFSFVPFVRLMPTNQLPHTHSIRRVGRIRQPHGGAGRPGLQQQQPGCRCWPGAQEGNRGSQESKGRDQRARRAISGPACQRSTRGVTSVKPCSYFMHALGLWLHHSVIVMPCPTKMQVPYPPPPHSLQQYALVAVDPAQPAQALSLQVRHLRCSDVACIATPCNASTN